MKNIQFTDIKEEDFDFIKEVYDYYVINTTTSFHTEKLSLGQLKEFILIGHENYKSLLIKSDNINCGFCYISQYKKRQAYDRTAEVTLYLKPEFTGHGIGKIVLSHLEEIARQKEIKIFLVRVTLSPDLKDSLKPISETSYQRNFDPSWSEYVPQLNIQPGDILITKHQWGAFYGTELDLQLRRRGIDTIILCGISTNFGVESTARFAYEFGYNQIFVEDAMSARSKEEHEATIKFIFPRLGLIRKTQDVISSVK